MNQKPVSVLEVAIERQDWEAAALCLLLGVSRAARCLPEGALDEMIAELSSELDVPRRHQRRGRRRDR